MTDRLIVFDGARMSGGLAVADGRILTTDGFATAVAVSLFSDRRAGNDDVLPGGTDRRGWWADIHLDEPLGSHLWLLHREKQMASVLVKARDYAEAALGWLVRKRYAREVTVTASVVRDGWLGLHVEIRRGDGSLWVADYQYHWRAHAA